MYDWNDLRHFLALMRAGSTLGAARGLRVNQTTVARRIEALERALGVPLFERHSGGYRPTARAHALLQAAEAVEDAALALDQRAGSWRREISGTLRVTATEAVGGRIIAPLIAELRQTHPGLTVELLAEDRRADLARGEADAAIRIGSPPDQDGLVARRLPDSVWGLYCSADYARRHGMPESLPALAAHSLVLGGGALADHAAQARLAALAPAAAVAARVGSIPGLVATVRSGAGIGALPCLLASEAPELRRCLAAAFAPGAPMWLIHHQSRRALPELRVFLDAAARHFEARRGVLAGSG
ncbi:LysR family transcriptional regulator [Rhodobacteraceae bacterium 2CG4]|uniref:LysR family transcriptional regulator n=1 Tax=Halovulum marinum TaxID=2662447 RepID=A0A6L5Z0J3_9RHOB|nr:LysR family transcriptional regulator [Halovulum marinum]MSU90086.1 LysR family transcriptional regulator [Halovulum marinum]